MLDIPIEQGFHGTINIAFGKAVDFCGDENEVIASIKAELQRLKELHPDAQLYKFKGTFKADIAAQDANEPL